MNIELRHLRYFVAVAEEASFTAAAHRVHVAQQVLSTQIRQLEDKVKPKVSFEVGETVKVADGPFQNQSGVVEEIDPDRGKLRVSVSIFGRSTPVELEYWQVERG